MFKRAAVLGVLYLFLGNGRSGDADAEARQPRSACTPELVYALLPGACDVEGAGTGSVAVLRWTDASGNPLPNTTGVVDWSVRTIVRNPKDHGAAVAIGGNLDLVITTATGDRLKYTATCIAGAGAYDTGVVLYADGVFRGWPGTNATRRTFVHFEAWQQDGVYYAYVALIDGSDCELDFSRHVVTGGPTYSAGTGSFSDLPADFVYAETDCSAKFGNPFPRRVAPALQAR